MEVISLVEGLLMFIAAILVVIMWWLAAIHGKISGAIERHGKTRDTIRNAVDYRKPHVFDPIGYAIDECECGLTGDAEIHSAVASIA